MPCDHPLTAYWSNEVNPSGKRGLVFRAQGSFSGVPVRINCQQCAGCRLEKSQEWAARCMHEAGLYENNEFVTLTYDPENCPESGSLNVIDHQKFMKRMRKRFGKMRFFMCGEYGGQTNRPHYHYILFNWTVDDKKFFKRNKRGEPLYTSEKLREVWPYGHNTLGAVTFDSAAYCARYVMDKRTGDVADTWYTRLTPDGVVYQMMPEFSIPSRKPGIGTGYFEKYQKELWVNDTVVLNGREIALPRFYDTKLEAVDPVRFEMLKKARRRRALKLLKKNTPERRRARAVIRAAKLSLAGRKEV